MTGTATVRMIEAYRQSREPTMFLSQLFRAPERNFFDSEAVEIDIEREDEDIAIAIDDYGTGPRINSFDQYTNKRFIPPALDEGFYLNRFDLNKRQAEQNPFDNPDFMANVTAQYMRRSRMLERKIRRTIELQAAQVLTTGKIDLKDSAGNTVYTIDYKPKASHFPTAGTPWGAPGATIMNDIQASAEANRDDGKEDTAIGIAGTKTFNTMIRDSDVLSLFDNRRMDVGRITPIEQFGNGGQYRGVLEVGTYRIELWTYNGKYKDPQTGVITKYIPDDKFVLLPMNPRFDAVFGSIPTIVAPDPRVARFIPSRMTGGGMPIDLTTNAWVDEKNRSIGGSIGTRPLMIPTAIDTYSCISTGV